MASTTNRSRMHVFADLKPYICTYENCPSALVTFPDRKSWAQHEFSCHRSDAIFKCHDCDRELTNEAAFFAHVEEYHIAKPSHTQLLALAAAAREIRHHPPHEQLCPLCLQNGWQDERKFITHVARHMEDIALGAVPRNDDTDIEAKSPHTSTTTSSDSDEPYAVTNNLFAHPLRRGNGTAHTFSHSLPGQQANAVPPNVFEAMPPIPEAVITRARMVNAQLRDMPRNQLIAILTAQRERRARKQMEQQAVPGQHNQFMPMPIPPGQIQGQPQPGGPPMGRQPSNQGLPQMGMSTQSHQSQPFPGTQRTQSVKPGPQPTQHVPLPGGKGNKRMSDDDVVEISGPVAGAQPRPQSTQILGKQMPGLAQDIIDKTSQTARQQYDSLRAQNQHNQQELIKKRIFELTSEVQSTMPVTLQNKSKDPDSRARILKVLTSDDTKNMLGRFDQLLGPYLLLTKDEAAVKRLISQRLYFLHQYKPNSIPTKVFEPQDNFSISADYAEGAMKEMIAKFQQTLEPTQKPAALRHPGLPPSQAHQPLSLEQLRQLQEQNEAQRKIKGAKLTDAPAAPTATQPPFPMGDSRGHGTPRYATQGLKQEDLKLDPSKKRKKKFSTGK